MRYLLFVLFFHFSSPTAQELRIYAVDEPPAAYINQYEQQDGYVLAIVKAMQKELSNNTPILFIPEGRALTIMAREPNVILIGISRTPSREHHYFWLAQVMVKKWQVYALSGVAMNIDTLDDLKVLANIGVVRGDVREEWLINRHFKNLNSVTLHKQNIQMLKLGRVNAIVYDEQGLRFHANTLGFRLGDFTPVYTVNMAPVYIVMSKYSNPTLVKNWQQAFKTISKNGELQNISEQWQTKLAQKYNMTSEIRNNILVF
ncbi:MAG: transporter substrate-binding domain-containing protein [Paraglaciecola sp.]|uniref:substrate-binding periplasmic protein n=1 Tax=Paraglaciecola sp. TaxID=1920173 RepID=UPI00273D0332|nr:transporter substrate-binding domain-containing protein [Paraglaciecola sp.]MDP5030604.1 transporter substrate-binding domain-containing protein [Paraglaciecola sp.]MDP5129681.1 transporter substrate-binding domain-containing protein [Paraglaciecola sp.]